MLMRTLLLSGIVLIMAQGLKGTAFSGGAAPQASESIPASSEAPPSDPALDSLEPSPSVSSSEAAIVSFRNPLLSSLILPLPPLILPELLLPPYNFPSFNSHRLDQELQLYSKYLRTFGTPDVLIVGSSRSLQGIDPAALQEALAAKGYPGLRVFNFGINGGTAQVNNLLLQRILSREQLPRLIIWGDGSRAFNSGRPDITYNGILASQGYKRLASGEQPIPSRIAAIKTVSYKATSSSAASPRSAPYPVAADLEANGFERVTGRYDPQTYYQRYPRVSGEFDADYANFQLTGEQANATKAVAQFARSQGITLVFVNLPLTEDYLDLPRRRYEQQFRQHMQRLAQQEKFILRDLSQIPDLMKNEYFVDPSHINQHGARAIAYHLATEPGIPWNILQASQEPVSSEAQ